MLVKRCGEVPADNLKQLLVLSRLVSVTICNSAAGIFKPPSMKQFLLI
jgi:hypothetical protein